ncbi:hypothetical protein [Streptomyces sp. AC495_CC817]|uniref:hypothetical protein n=1 Tax=Streptomyces sp. AC495_CC817 TaxID=2823900 RepID=UPI001C276C89|nr:hypothetical protein [Streptomyces sp. AC495_CC817]
MRSSTVPARIIAIVFALIAAPAGAGMLSTGGREWSLAFSAFGPIDPTTLLGPVLLQILGGILLLAVVATGFWTSAGLLATGVLGLGALAGALLPAVVLPLYRSPVPSPWVDGLVYGVPLVLFCAFGAMGLVLLLARRSPARPHPALQIVGLVATPVLLAGGALLIALGLARGPLVAFQQYRFDVAPDAVAALLAGVVLVLVGILLTRWSPFALLLPALVLLVLTPMALTPASPLYDAFLRTSMELSRTAPLLLSMGTGVVTALAYVLFTVILLRVRSRVRILPGTYVAPLGPDGYPVSPTLPAQPPYTAGG